MITSTQLTHWSNVVPWISGDQVEQDLVLSLLIVEIAQDPYLGDELVFRGGTCLHKLYDTGLARYSEDLDYVRRSGGGIGELTRAVTAIGELLGMDVRTKIGLGVAPEDLVACFGPYRPDGYTARRAELNLREKLDDEGFRRDLTPLVGAWPEGYDIDEAGDLVAEQVLPLL